MTKPIADKAEVALEYPDKLYVGTFERSSRFEAHLDPTGIALVLERPGADDVLHLDWRPIATAPADANLELSIYDKGEYHGFE